MNTYFTPDVLVPVHYTTRTGRSVSCSIAIALTSPSGESTAEFRSYAASHDWSELGQRIYLEAVRSPFVPRAEALNEWDAPSIEEQSWYEALNRVIREEIPYAVRPTDFELHISSTCEGILS